MNSVDHNDSNVCSYQDNDDEEEYRDPNKAKHFRKLKDLGGLDDHVLELWKNAKLTGDKRATETKIINELVDPKPGAKGGWVVNSNKPMFEDWF